jgi:uncharacterized protein YndB with AHSA1/START domain
MSVTDTSDTYGTLIEPTTLQIQRVLPGPIERVWDYLTRSDLRRQWLAAGDMAMSVGGEFELVWRNDELTNPPGHRPDGFEDDHRMTANVTEIDPPHRLAYTWGNTGGVTFELETRGDQVLLTLTHRRIADRNTRLNISAGWHMHLDVLAARLSGFEPEPFWDGWLKLKGEYEARLPQ